MRKFFKDNSGSVSAYSALFIVAALGLGSFAIDYGRVTVARTQMQNYADAGALAGAVYLDGRIGARMRAEAVARNAMADASGIVNDDSELEIGEVSFYSQLSPEKVPASSDLDARYIEVTLEPRNVDYLFRRFLNFLSDRNEAQSTEISARAVARSEPYVCNAPPMMVCDLAEVDPSMDLRFPYNAGRQVVLKEPQGGGNWAPGNFGLLALPDGSSGASAIETALAEVQPQDCYGYDVGTAPGSKTNKVKSGINVRFETSSLSYPPAPNVINYPRDAALIENPDDKLGNGNWDIEGYWEQRHGTPLPPELAGATRYQVYLYELGEEFARDGRITYYPVNEQTPPGAVLVSPSGAMLPEDPDNPDDPDYDGVPSATPAGNGPARRLMVVAQLQCIADNVKGSGTYPTNGNYVEVFITETVKDPPNAAIYAEIVRPVTAQNNPEYHANVQLVR